MLYVRISLNLWSDSSMNCTIKYIELFLRTETKWRRFYALCPSTAISMSENRMRFWNLWIIFFIASSTPWIWSENNLNVASYRLIDGETLLLRCVTMWDMCLFMISVVGFNLYLNNYSWPKIQLNDDGIKSYIVFRFTIARALIREYDCLMGKWIGVTFD